jgi:hypothetical protein
VCTGNDQMLTQDTRNFRSYQPESPSDSERGTHKPLTISGGPSIASLLAPTRPNRATRTSTYDDHPCKDGSTHAPPVRHIVHANVMQASAISGPLANANIVACSNNGCNATKLKGVLETKACAIEHTGTQGAIPQLRRRRKPSVK